MMNRRCLYGYLFYYSDYFSRHYHELKQYDFDNESPVLPWVMKRFIRDRVIQVTEDEKR